MEATHRISRRQAIGALGASLAGVAAVALLSACGSASTPPPGATAAAGAAPTSPPAANSGATPKPATGAAATPTSQTNNPAEAKIPPTPTAVPVSANVNGNQGALKQVPRNRTLVLGVTGNELLDYSEVNPFLTTTSTSTGYPYAFEAPYYYDPYYTTAVCGPPGMQCKDGEMPWLATGYSYNSAHTEVTMNLRQGVTWSDGQPFTSKDVVFTINMLKKHAPKLNWSIDMKLWVKDVVATDAQTVKFILTKPNPQFFFSYFQFHEDIGIQIVPEHIWSNVDPTTFTNLNVAKGWPVTTGPWKLALSSPQQRIWDRNDNWWAAATKFHPLPAVERIIIIPGTDETKMVEMAISNETDETIDLRPNNIRAVVGQNPKIQTWTGTKPPFGYLDWWPVSLGFNDSKAPFDDPDIRWAINYAIDRDQLVQIGYQGAGSTTLLPFPNFPALVNWLDKANVKSLLAKYQIAKKDPTQTAAIMQAKGYKKDSHGFWAKNGKQFSLVIQSLILFQDITPVLIAQLRKAGFNASFKISQNFGTIISLGEEDAFILGHGGSVRDPYFTMRLYQTRYSAPTGKPATYPYRWKNTQYDKLVDEMGVTAATDPKFLDLFKQALDIWMKNLPDIGLVQWYHRIPTNTTYWTNWPNEQNPYINTAFWHRTSPLWINTIQPAQK